MLPDLGVTSALLLQGPAGPFMRRLAIDLANEGIAVTKVNFHAGDVLFFRGTDAVAFRGTREEWPAFVRELMDERSVDGIFLFGDCRALHRDAIEAARERGARVWVFEEGYLRPDWITLEQDGVNGYSTMPKDPSFYRGLDLPEPAPPTPNGASFWYGCWYSTLNALAFTHLNGGFPHYEHHRNLNAWFQTFVWVRNVFRKQLYERRERPVLARLTSELTKRYWFVPLQVHCDFQLVHSPYGDVLEFVEQVLDTFIQHADPTHHVVFKHHPMDRPYREYTRYFRDLARARGVEGRLHYVHDVDLRALIEHACGTITINSTAGIASLEQGTPVKVMGTAIYDMPGLTFQGSLRDFLTDPGTTDAQLYHAFRRYLLHTNQINGSFYRRLPGHGRGVGARWFPPPALSERRADARVQRRT